MWQIVIGGVLTLWIVGRLSRRSANHPLNTIPQNIVRSDIANYPAMSSQQETAQIPGFVVAGEDGGE